MEPIEDLLRRELRRTDKAPSVSEDVLLARVRRIRRKRHAIATGLAALLLGAAAVAAVSLPGSADPRLGDTRPQTLIRLFNVVFTDADHGYALQRRCSMVAAASGLREECRMQLLATADGGGTWQGRLLPDEASTEAALTDPFWNRHPEFHRSLLLWVDAPGTVAVGGRDLRYWTTSDGGVTWQESPTARPEVAQLGRVTFFGPDDKLVTVRNPSAWQNETLVSIYGIVAATDGSVWLPGRSLAGVYYFTHDLGETWQTATFPGVVDVRWVSTWDGRNLFAVYRDGTKDRLVRSTDSGNTWEEVSGMPDTSLGGTRGLALPNGDLLMMSVGDGSTMMRLKAGSKTAEYLAPLPHDTHINLLYVTGGVVVAFGGSDGYGGSELGSAASMSHDNGVTWTPIPVAER